MNQGFPQKDLSIERKGGLALVTLDRPQILNALSLEMIRQLAAHLRRWEKDGSIRAVFITGAGERAFSAGGDMKAVYLSGMEYRRGEAEKGVAALFFGEEYWLNRQIFHYSKPVISFMNGITMGGGYGIAGHARYKIAAESTVFAMPEVGIGFFPDVGSMYHLTRCPDNIGRYLALSGVSIGAADMLRAGLATHFVPRARAKDLTDRLAGAGGDINGAIETLLAELSGKPGQKSVLADNIDVLREIFSQEDPERLLALLDKHGGAFAAESARTIRSRCPVSIKVTAQYYAKAKTMDFDTVTEMDFTLAQNFLRTHDFYEGVRAAVIHKDRNPAWDPADLADVSAESVRVFFKKTGLALSDIPIFSS